jgi:broad specificity phosphatase PhoE
MIILMRHAIPDIDYSCCNAMTLIERLNAYHSTYQLHLQQLDEVKKDLHQVLADRKIKIHTSSLPRSYATAQFLFDKNQAQFQVNSIFSEFDLPLFAVPLLKLPVKVWVFLFRILWFLGFHRESAPFDDEKQRAKAATGLLLNEHQDDTVSILIGHGWMNRYIKSYLKNTGWTEAVCHGARHFFVLENTYS